VSCAKTAEPIDDLPFRLWIRVGRRKQQIQSYSPGGANGRVHWRNLANTIPAVCGGDVALC